MDERFPIRTDLALESGEQISADGNEIRGVVVEKEKDEESGIFVTRVVIETENGARVMQKPIGNYLTIEAPALELPDEDYHREVSEKTAVYLKELLPGSCEKILVAGLGNREVTPDALGPHVVDNLYITRHIMREYGKNAFEREHVVELSGIAPGVMAQTGMETLEILKGIIQETLPSLLIVVDALAARSIKRLGRTIQLSDTGIHPGSGVGNHRVGLNKDSVGIPVIAIGVPTVVDAGTIVYDACKNAAKLEPGLESMFVTPKNIDEMVRQVSYTISEALHLAFF